MNCLLATLIISTSLLATPALAHADLKSSAPADDAVVTAPTELELGFSEVLNLAFSGIKVTGPDDAIVETAKPEAIGDGTAMTVGLPAQLAPGVYVVEWNVLSTDGHKLNGTYSFTVVP